MPKQKIIKLKAVDREEIDKLHYDLEAARCGVETSQQIHYEAGKRLWDELRRLYPELENCNVSYGGGVLTCRPKKKGA